MSLHFGWVNCPECGSNEVYDVGADDAPEFAMEYRDCGHLWSMAGFAFCLQQEEEG